MKKLKVSILALSVLVGGAVFASAATSATIMSTSDVFLTNAPAPLIWSSPDALPTFSLFTNVDYQAQVVNTDGNGKIAGVANIVHFYNTSGTNVTAIGSWYTTAKGTIKATVMGKPSVQLSMKGEGYVAPGTNGIIIIPGQVNNGFPGKFSLTFSAKDATAVPISTNGAGDVTARIVGTLKGTITPPTGDKKSEKIDTTAGIDVRLNRQGEIGLRVIVFGTKFAAILHGTDATGTGTIKNGAYKLNLKPVSGGSSSLQLDGQIVAVVDPSSTNRTVTTVNTANVKGKIQGQAVQSTGFKFRAF